MEPQPNNLDAVVNKLHADARERDADLHLDPERLARIGEGVINQLQEAADSDGTPKLLNVPETGGIPWKALISLLTRQVQEEIGKKDSRIPVGGGDTGGLDTALTACEELRQRMAQAIDGAGARRAASNDLRHHIFGGRNPIRTKASWENELRMQLSSITGLGASAPPAVRALAEEYPAILEKLEAAQPKPGRRKAAGFEWSPAVLERATVLQLALNDLLQWAAATASPKRRASLTRVIAPKRRADSSKAATDSSGGDPVIPPKKDGPAQ